MSHGIALLKAVRYFGSQKAMGKALNISQQRLNYWINCSNQIAYDYVLKIEAYTNGYVTRDELAPEKKEINQIIDKLIEIHIKKYNMSQSNNKNHIASK